MALVKPIREKGMILNKHINEAREAGESADGSFKWNAREKEYVLNVISCDEETFDKINGFSEAVTVNYTVDEQTYKEAKFGDWCNVKYELRNGEKDMRPKAISCSLIKNIK